MSDDTQQSLAPTTWFSADERRVEGFLSPELARVGPRVIVRVEVRVVRGGECARFERAMDSELFESARRLAIAVCGACAANVTGAASETFSVIAVGFCGARSSMRLRMQGEESEVEEPTSTGALEQMIRHNEVLLHATLRGSSATNDVLATMNERLLARVSDLEEKRQKHVDEREALESARHQRELEMQQTAAREARRSAMAQKFLGDVAPLIMAKLSGGAAISSVSPKSPRDHMVDQLIRSFFQGPRERLQALAQLLSPTELALFVQLGEDVEPLAPTSSADDGTTPTQPMKPTST